MEEVGSNPHRISGVFYGLSVCTAIFVAVSTAVVTDHWKDNIGGCILYSSLVENPQKLYDLKGSSYSNCSFVIFTPVFLLIVATIFLAYHLKHVLCKSCMRPEEGKNTFWITFIVPMFYLNLLMALLSLVVACMLTHGHDVTCGEVRQYVVKNANEPWMGIQTEQLKDFYGRIDCSFFFSALDYGLTVGHDNVSSIIDSSMALGIAQGTAWIQFILWTFASLNCLWFIRKLELSLLPFRT